MDPRPPSAPTVSHALVSPAQAAQAAQAEQAEQARSHVPGVRIGMALLVAIAVASACAPDHASGVPRSADTDSVGRIADQATWDTLAIRPAYATSARTEALKFIVDLEDGNRLYLLDSNRWDLHYAFVRAYIDRLVDHAHFNVQQYRRDDRRFVLGTLVHYLDGAHWTFELVAGDTLDMERLAWLHGLLRDHVFFGADLRFRPSSPAQETYAASLGARLPSISTEAVFADVRYQPVVVGDAYGILRLHRGELDLATLRPDEIIVTDDVPEEISPIGALVTSRIQAPLAHVAVLSRNRRTPDMALRGAIDDPRFTALEGQLVHLRVTPQDFTLTRATAEEAAPTWARLRPATAFVPTMNTNARELVDVARLRMGDVSFAGAKAAQLGELMAIGPDIATPGGFVVPLHFDLAHRRRHGFDRRIDALLGDARLRSDPLARAAALAELRASITSADVDPTLVADVHERLHREPGARFILRSSTNAEDLVGFNGAGLYESIVVPNDASPEVIGDALRRVWASVWLTRAFEEREWFRIDHAHVAMAILVQPFVDDVVGNGVAITANPFYQGRPGVLINAQGPSGSVTGARGDEIPEQFLVYTWSETLEPELLSRSSLTGGAPILLGPDVLALTAQLARIHEHFMPFYGRAANAVDVEFLLTRQRRFVFVQARAYRVDYGAGQTWRPPGSRRGSVEGPVR